MNVNLARDNKWKLNKEIFGPLWPLVLDQRITDIDWDGDALWIERVDGTKCKMILPELDAWFIDNFTQYVANHVARPFNQVENTLSAETDTLRITVAHESLVTSGRCFSIRKSMPKLRFTAGQAIAEHYCSAEFLHFLVNCVSLHMNFAFCGEPGHGKTECAKFLSTFIQEAEKVITVEDTLEWHYKAINPGKRADEIKVNDHADYTKAIKLALRLNPTWLMLSEARSVEVRYLIEAWTTGICGMTTLHTNDVRNIPDRIVNMMEKGVDTQRMVNNIYSHLNIGILLEKEENCTKGASRKIKQAAVFYRNQGSNYCELIVENGVFYPNRLPEEFLKRFSEANIQNPLYSPLLNERIRNEEKGIYYGMEEYVEWETQNTQKVAEEMDTWWKV